MKLFLRTWQRHHLMIAFTVVSFLSGPQSLPQRDASWLQCTLRNQWAASSVEALFCRRRHQPRRPALAKIRPGTPGRHHSWARALEARLPFSEAPSAASALRSAISSHRSAMASSPLRSFSRETVRAVSRHSFASRRYSSTVLLKANLRPIDIRREDGRMCSGESRESDMRSHRWAKCSQGHPQREAPPKRGHSPRGG